MGLITCRALFAAGTLEAVVFLRKILGAHNKLVEIQNEKGNFIPDFLNSRGSLFFLESPIGSKRHEKKKQKTKND